MNILSGFNLFVRQALLYPLTSPFLPAVADVKKDVSYANGKLLGTLESGGAELVWQSVFTFTGDWYGAVDYALHLEADGVTVNASPQNIWRLPKISELINAVCQQFIEGGTEGPGGFLEGPVYWSGVENAGTPGDVFACYYVSFIGVPSVGSYGETTEKSVRCVKI